MLTYKHSDEVLPPLSEDVRETLRLCALEDAERLGILEDRRIMAELRSGYRSAGSRESDLQPH